MHNKLIDEESSKLEKFFIGNKDKIFNADYIITSTIQILLIISYIILAEYAKRHIGEHASIKDPGIIKIILSIFECYMVFLVFILIIQSAMLSYRQFSNIFLSILYIIYYLGLIIMGGPVVLLLKL